MACFGLKLGQDLGNRAAHPYRKFRGVTPPPPGYSSMLTVFISQKRLMSMNKLCPHIFAPNNSLMCAFRVMQIYNNCWNRVYLGKLHFCICSVMLSFFFSWYNHQTEFFIKLVIQCRNYHDSWWYVMAVLLFQHPVFGEYSFWIYFPGTKHQPRVPVDVLSIRLGQTNSV